MSTGRAAASGHGAPFPVDGTADEKRRSPAMERARCATHEHPTGVSAMTNATATATEAAVELLVGEGHHRRDVITACDSFIDADGRDMDEVGWSDEDIDVLRDQLAAAFGRERSS